MITLSLWSTRRAAENALKGGLKPFADLLDETFSVLDICIDRLEKLNQPFGRVCGLVVIKARNLGLGCYSLTLDGLAQEAGALFRPFLECLELLTYFRLDTTRINEALEDRLPQAGVIAQRIEGKFKALRDYLNAHASHLSISPESMVHLVDIRTSRLRPVQLHNDSILRGNLTTLLGVLIWIAIEAVNCTTLIGGITDDIIAETVEDIRRRTVVLVDEPISK